MSKKSIKFSLFFLLAAFIFVTHINSASAQYYTVNTNESVTFQNTIIEAQNPQFSVQVLKYQPYPVNPGDWFDLWVQVKNIGLNDAPDLRIQFVPVYPFDMNNSNDTAIRDFGLVSGVTAADLNKLPEDQQGQDNQIVVKFRIRVADNAPEGTNFARIQIQPDKSNPKSAYSFDLPIIVGNTKTDFDVIMQDSSSQGTSFSIVNIGANPATAVIMTIEDQDGVRVTGARSSVLGNLDAGDFTTQTFQVSYAGNSALNASQFRQTRNFTNQTQQITNSLKVDIAYTDISGIRSSVEKVVPVNLLSSSSLTAAAGRAAAGRQSVSSGFSSWLFLAIGLIVGFLIEFFIHKAKIKKMQKQ